MKKLITIILLLLTFISGNAQEIVKTDTKPREEIVSAPVLICSNTDRDKWFTIIPTFKKLDDILIKTYLVTMKLNIGKCSKEDILVFTFTNGKKIKILAKNEKNCDGIIELIFPLNSIDVAFLEKNTLESIKYINGNDQVSFTYFTTKENRNYFVNTFGTYKR